MHAMRAAATAVASLAILAGSATAQEATEPIASDAAAIALESLEAPATLEPGRYTRDTMELEIGFEVDGGWTAHFESPGLVLVGDDGQRYIDIHEFGGEFLARPCQTSPDDDTWHEDVVQVGTTADAFVQQLRSAPHLSVSASVPLDIDGRVGAQVDVTVDVDEACLEPSDRTNLWLSPTFGDSYFLPDGIEARIVVIEVDDRAIVAVMEALGATDPPSFFDEGSAIIGSMELLVAPDEEP